MSSNVREQGEKVRRFILKRIDARHDIVAATMKEFSITRQAVNKHIHKLKEQGAIQVDGSTKAARYTLCPLVSKSFAYPVQPGLAEDVVWTKDIRPAIEPLPDNALNIWQYAFTEMLNNAIDHSAGSRILVHASKTALATKIHIHDDGVGIFRKIQQELGLMDERLAIFELAKGKLTTDPANHTGEGIFFTSRVMDQFRIVSGGLFFNHDRAYTHDWLVEREQPKTGTSVFMTLDNHATRTTREIFDEFTGGEDFAFSKTIVPLSLAKFGSDELMSRSQAKRVLARVNLFSSVIFDFKDVEQIGQAFADQIFRVYANAHPNLQISAINMCEAVKDMVNRATRA